MGAPASTSGRSGQRCGSQHCTKATWPRQNATASLALASTRCQTAPPPSTPPRLQALISKSAPERRHFWPRRSRRRAASPASGAIGQASGRSCASFGHWRWAGCAAGLGEGDPVRAAVGRADWITRVLGAAVSRGGASNLAYACVRSPKIGRYGKIASFKRCLFFTLIYHAAQRAVIGIVQRSI
jgi:hypothetical protein